MCDSMRLIAVRKEASISILEIFEWYPKNFFAEAPKYGDALSYILCSIPAGGALYGQLSKLNLAQKLELSQTAVSPGCNFDVFAAETESYHNNASDACTFCGAVRENASQCGDGDSLSTNRFIADSSN